MVGLSVGFPLAAQPIVNPQTGQATQSWLTFFQSLWTNASSTTLPDNITLPPGVVNLAAFAPFLHPVGSGSSLPTAAGYTGTPFFFDTTDGNLYRYVNGAWTLSVPASAIIGEVPIGAIPPIPTSQLTGYLQAAQIQANSIGADQISAAYIYAGNIAATQITAGTLSAAVILSSNIAATQINAGTLSAGVILSSTINATQINAGTLTAFTIQSGSSGARYVLDSSGNITGYDRGGIPFFTVSAGSANLEMRDSSNQITFSAGTGFTSAGVFHAYLVDGHTEAIRATGTSSAANAIICPTGGITISNGYLAMGGGNITGLGSNLTSSAATLFIAAGTNVTTVGNSLPNSDNTYSLGNASFRWSAVWAANGTIQTSDRRMKKNIKPETLGLCFINALKPVSYNWITDPPKAPSRHGFIAQDVEDALGKASFAGLERPQRNHKIAGMSDGCAIDGMTPFGLVYNELLPSIVLSIQELSQKVKYLEGKISS